MGGMTTFTLKGASRNRKTDADMFRYFLKNDVYACAIHNKMVFY
jgi:hypothetical protein